MNDTPEPTPSPPPVAPSVAASPPPAPPSPFTGLSLHELRAAAGPQAHWLWHGYLAPGNITLLTSQWKAGKTTLISVLLDRLKTGGTLAGLAVAPGRAVVVSEESPAHWYRRSKKLA